MPDTRLDIPPVSDRTPPAPRLAWRRMLAEPLVHFLALGVLLFAVSAALAPPPDRAKVIAVTPEVRREISDLYQASNGRQPTPAELAPLVDNWVRTQILYREALAIGLDKGDEMIRERITYKMNLLVFSRLDVPTPTEAELRAWFEAHRARYDEPVRYNFFGLAVDGADGQAEAERIAKQLGREDVEPPAELVERVRAYGNRDRAGLADLFGPAFADGLAEAAPDTWRALPTAEGGKPGWLVARVAQVLDGKRARFEDVRGPVEDAWRDETTRRMANEAVTKMGAKYTVERGPAP